MNPMNEPETQFTIAKANFKRAKAEMESIHGNAASQWNTASAVDMAYFYRRWCMRFYDLAHDDYLNRQNDSAIPRSTEFGD
jgi:hypothetical protein